MFDLGWTELLLIGAVALIVIGPKDLPNMFRTLGRTTARIRGMAREFQRAMEDAADDSGMKDMGKTLRDVANPKKMGLDAVKDAVGDLGSLKPDAPKKAMGSETAKLSAERAEQARKIREQAAKKLEERKAAEALQGAPDPDPAPAGDGLVADPGAPKTDHTKDGA